MNIEKQRLITKAQALQEFSHIGRMAAMVSFEGRDREVALIVLEKAMEEADEYFEKADALDD